MLVRLSSTIAATGIAVLSLVVLLFFQNCAVSAETSPAPAWGTAQMSSSGNGGGYSGKLSYVLRATEGICADGVDSESEIEIENGEARQTRANCRAIGARSLNFNELNLLAHNPANLIYGARPFDRRSDRDERTRLLCRGERRDEKSGVTEIADALIKERTEGGRRVLFGRAVLGLYDRDGRLTQIYDLGEVPLREVEQRDGFTGYLSETYERREAFLLRVRDADARATLFYRDNITGRAAGEGDVRPVPGLRCYGAGA